MQQCNLCQQIYVKIIYWRLFIHQKLLQESSPVQIYQDERQTNIMYIGCNNINHGYWVIPPHDKLQTFLILTHAWKKTPVSQEDNWHCDI